MNHIQFRVPFGAVTAKWSDDGLLQQIEFAMLKDAPSSWSLLSRTVMPSKIGGIMDSLKAYLEKGTPYGPIPWELVDASPFTEFQCRIYRAICQIPFGETRTYSWVAQQSLRESPKGTKLPAARAVGQALKKNPLPILIPCHRVVASKNVGGFMGKTSEHDPEIKMKQWLINRESIYMNPIFPFVKQVEEGALLLQYA